MSALCKCSERITRVAGLPLGSGRGDPPSHIIMGITCDEDELSNLPTALNVTAPPFQSSALTDSLVNEGVSEYVSSRDRVYCELRM